ncbi:MAG: redoxin domain-containing protein [Planctomycetes bacterium]|nr:redoxin domain-containing protein [Planctomycetota bacterium]MCH9727545.1 redoxin domain-containing protein [Planctomycetota bacterium]MCH9777475.1 redoxin domain-containing protein [Planctomycetota bacterium]MCH9791762.1 redoxin domain-containing protein [Planctomycetota bacterium]
MSIGRISLFTVFALLIWFSNSLSAADAPSVELALTFQPIQKDIEIEIPEKAEYSRCKVEVEQNKKSSGWIVYGPNGQVLRRFVDTNGDNVVDQWRYFNRGLEVYRDIDTNFNNKVDGSRWMNLAGTRWGIDRDEDGTIDEWKMISAEEVTRVAIAALAKNDTNAFKTLMITEKELTDSGIKNPYADKIRESVKGATKEIPIMLTKTKMLTPETVWVRFDGSMPGLIPADDVKTDKDLHVFENVMAIVDTKGKSGLIQFGELIRVGNSWRLTQVPLPIEGESMQVTEGGILMQPVAGNSTLPTNSTVGLSKQMQGLLDELQKLDQNSPTPDKGAQAISKYNTERVVIIEKLIAAAKNDDDRAQWTRQMVDGLAAAVQTVGYKDGLKQLQAIRDQVQKSSQDQDLVAYVTYRTLLADYSSQLQSTQSEKLRDVQTWWLKQLEDFIKKYPNSDDSAEAMLQLAVTQEFSGKVAESKKWYTKLVENHGKSEAGTRGAGALRRMNLAGKNLELTGSSLAGGSIDAKQYQGKALLVIFWSSWCKPCTEDLPQIQEIYSKYHSQGFDVLGINLDATADLAETYIKQHKIAWSHIHEEGGLESAPARDFGVISLPTMFLVDKSGKVVNRSATVSDLKKALPDLLK